MWLKGPPSLPDLELHIFRSATNEDVSCANTVASHATWVADPNGTEEGVAVFDVPDPIRIEVHLSVAKDIPAICVQPEITITVFPAVGESGAPANSKRHKLTLAPKLVEPALSVIWNVATINPDGEVTLCDAVED